MKARLAVIAAATTLLLALSVPMTQAADGPSLVDRNLTLATPASGFVTPIGIAFIDEDEWLVIEKNTGKVEYVVDGTVAGTALDLSVNFGSERGLLGIALHPDFPDNPGVYLFWSCLSVTPQDDDPFTPEEERCDDAAMTGVADTDDLLQVPLIGNRVDRFEWDNGELTYDHNLEMLRSFQNDGGPEPPDQGDAEDAPLGVPQPARANHDGGVLTFGDDGKLYVIFGDVGRRGALQNLPCGPTATECNDPEDVTPDDQFGGPEPDDAHFSGVILRLNDDGSTPADNPFFDVGADIGGEVGENIQRIYSYGIRNSFGMAVDPKSGNLWQQENGEDAYDEVNRVEAGQNSGWIQFAGPADRIGEYREIETTSLHHEDLPNLQQFRWDPQRIATTAAEARARLFELPGSTYSDPEFSWKFVLAPAAIGFQAGRALGPQYDGDLFMGFSTLDTLDGPLFRFNLTGNRRAIGVDDPRLKDRVADNATFHDMTESESLVFGTGFGIVTDIETGPNGNLYVVSLDQGAVYEIGRR